MKAKARRLGAISAASGLAVLFQAVALVQGAAADEWPEPSPGITVTGIGFAHLGPEAHAGGAARARALDVAKPVAVNRAVADATRRAEAIAREFGVEVGPPTEVELDAKSPFGSARKCRSQDAGKRSNCPKLTDASVQVTFAIVGAPAVSSATAITAVGAASVEVEPRDPKRNQPIKRAVLAARKTATVEAATSARRNARMTAESAGLARGSLISVSELPQLRIAFIPEDLFPDPVLGSFGPGQFCGFVRRPAIVRDPKTGKPRRIRYRRQYRCRVPREYSLSLEVRYATG